jgi:hypothetical protein
VRRCGECGSEELVPVNIKGRKFPYKQYEWVELAVDFQVTGCAKCPNYILKSGEMAALDAVIEESLRRGTNTKLAEEW